MTPGRILQGPAWFQEYGPKEKVITKCLSILGISWPFQTIITFSVLIDIHTAFIFNSEISLESQSDEDIMGILAEILLLVSIGSGY